MDAKLTFPPFDSTLFRQDLHKTPELSKQEEQTSRKIALQLREFGFDPITKVGGHGVICFIDSGTAGPTTLLRADFDALPIVEKAQHDHVSQHEGVMHACGHDGHTTSLLSVASQLALNPPRTGKVILLFQPAEEIGTGANAMLQDDRLSSLAVDNAFAYHNLPGYPLGEILVKQGTYACASTGVVINFTGKTSHAARPENGVSPVGSVIETIQYLESLPEHYPDSFGLVTIVHVQVGDAAFGVAPGEAKVMATMRSDNNDTFERMKRDICKKLTLLKQSSGIEISLSWDEPFSAAVNSSQHVRVIEQQANSLGLNVQTLPEPMRWSEDFAEFLKKWPGALFCIGSGESHPELHNPDYDFPDEIIETAATLFMAVVNRLHHG